MINRQQLKKIVIKELHLCEQMYEMEKLIKDKVMDSVLDGINAAVSEFAAGDEQLEDVASIFAYDDDKSLDVLLDDDELFKKISAHLQEKTKKILETNKEEILKRKSELSEPIDSTIEASVKEPIAASEKE